MTPIGTAAPGNAAILVARILQPLARSLEEARRHLDLETVASDEADDEIAPEPAPAPLYFAAPGTRRAFDRIAAREGDTAYIKPPSAHPHAPETWPDMAASASTPEPGVAGTGKPSAAPAPRFMRVVTEYRATPHHHDTTPASAADITSTRLASPPASPPAFLARHAPPAATQAGAGSPTPNRTAPEISALGIDAGKHPPQLRMLTTPAQTAPHVTARPGKESGPAATPVTHPRPQLASSPAHTRQQASAPAPGANPPAPALGPAARQPLQSANPPTVPRHWRLRPAAHANLPTPATHTAHDDLAREATHPAASATPPQSAPTAPGPATVSPAPSQLPRTPALTRVLQAMDPVLDKAWQLTDAALAPDSNTAPPGADAPRVSNNFNVSVALGDASSAAGRDPQQLHDALVALLRDAARRQGLDV